MPSFAAIRSQVGERIDASGRYQRWVLLTALTGMFATTFPVTILTVSLGTIADDLQSSETTLAWVISGPLLASAVALPVLGKMGDLHGHRRVFLTGFFAASVLAGATALAWNAGSLIAVRVLAITTGAATMPTSMALIMAVYPRAERAKAMGWWSLVAAASPSIGLVAGGLLIDAFGWQLIFVIQAVLGLAATLVGALVLRETIERPDDVRFDVAGALTLALGAGSLMFALNQGVERGLGDPLVLAAIAATPVGLALFVRAEHRADAPLLPLELLSRGNFTFPLVALLFQGAAYMGGFVVAPLLIDGLFGYSLSAISLLILIRTLMFSLTSPVGGTLSTRWGERATAVAGTGAVTVALLGIAVGASTTSIAVIVAALAVQGVANGLAQPPLNASLANSVDETDLGIASAAGRMAFQVGSSMGITLMTAVYGGDASSGTFTLTYLIGAGLGLCGAAAAWAVRSTDRSTPPEAAVRSDVVDADPSPAVGN